MVSQPTHFDINIKLTFNYRETITEDEAMNQFGTTDINMIDMALNDTVIDNLTEYLEASDFESAEVEVSEY